MASFEKTPPQHIDAERALLGAMLLNEDAIDVAVNILGENPDAFYVENHGAVYMSIIALYRDGQPADIVTLSQEMDSRALARIGGSTYLSDLLDAVPTSANAEYYAEYVRDAWVRRRLITTCSRACSELFDKDAETDAAIRGLEEGLFSASTGRAKSKSVKLSNLIPAERDKVVRMLDGEALEGVGTGFHTIDAVLRPMASGDYVVVAARPSVGKTTFACNLALNMLRDGVPVLFLTLEMRAEAIAQKILGIAAGTDMMMVEKGRAMKAVEEGKLNRAYKELLDLPLFIDYAPGLSPIEMRSKIRQAVQRDGVQIAIIDYLGLMTPPKAENRTNEVAIISRELKAAAGEAGIPIIALSQLNREGADTKPKISNIRDSGAIEQDGDIVILLSRIEAEPNLVLVDIAKQRSGPVAEVRMMFEKNLQRFHDLSQREAPPVQQQIRTPYADNEPFDEYERDGFGNRRGSIEYEYEEEGSLI